MKRKTLGIAAVLVGVLVLCLGAGGFLMTRRMARMHGASGRTPGGLVAVSPSGGAVQAPQEGANLPENTAAQVVEGLNVSLAMAPYPPTSYGTTDFEVKLLDAEGKPVEDAKVSLDLTMPEMWMPPNSLELLAEGDVYKGQGRYTMRGWWRIEVIIERGGQKTSAFFDVEI